MECTQCGREVVGEKCYNPSCQAYWKDFWERRVKEKIADHQREVNWLQNKESDLTLEDYSTLKEVEQEVQEWEKKDELKTSLVKLEIEKLLQDIEKTEEKFPERIKLKATGKSRNCYHKNISWNDLFQKEKSEEPYCLDCGEDENSKFTKAFQSWYCEKVKEWLQRNSLKTSSFTIRFLKKKNFRDEWQKLEQGKMFEDIKDEFFAFQESNKLIEEYLLEFAKEEGKEEPERERERETRITTQN
jgi:hypothetical protein